MKQTKALSLDFNKTIVLTRLLWVVAFTGLTFLGAKIEIPTEPVPYTLQTMFVLLSAAFLGPYLGALSQFIYLALGSAGLPVFAGPIAGFSKLLGPTGGYLLAPISAFVVGYLVKFKNSYWWIAFSMFCGLILIFAFGTIQLNLVLIHNWGEAIKSGFLIFSFWDLLKLFASASIYASLKRFYK
ncbi:biotin transport system substrate-specific component [Candidatus Kryptonium thompsonii]|nr:biotin transport system substrate-specific component [Candidatus Kryptonium thompsoni]